MNYIKQLEARIMQLEIEVLRLNGITKGIMNLPDNNNSRADIVVYAAVSEVESDIDKLQVKLDTLLKEVAEGSDEECGNVKSVE